MRKGMYCVNFGFWDVKIAKGEKEEEWAKKSIATGKQIKELISGCQTDGDKNLVYKTKDEAEATRALANGRGLVEKAYGGNLELIAILNGGMNISFQHECLKCGLLAPLNATECTRCRTKLI